MYGLTEEFNDFITNWKTWVILNGGTMNDERDFDDIPKGSMNNIADGLQKNDIMFSYFLEPDLNNGLSALCFICDERVFNRKDYPDFVDEIINTSGQNVGDEDYNPIWCVLTRSKSIDELIEQYPMKYKSWVRNVGGVKNVFLRDLIKGKKLA